MWWSDVIPAKAGTQPEPRARFTAFAGMTVALLLSACGFQLRGDPSVGLPSLNITQVMPTAVTADIRRVLEQGPTKLVADPKQAAAQLRLLGETREKTVHTITSTGRVYEFQLRLAVRFEVLLPNRELPLIPATEVESRRVISYSETAPTAKETEEQLLFKDMQLELADRILRQITVARREM
jgi:LPS-assembly lipoprotein